MLVDGGNVNMDYVTIRNNWGVGGGSAIYFYGGNKTTATIDDCLIEWCHASNSGPALLLINTSKAGSSCTVNRTTIRYNDTSLGNHLGCGGAVRTIGDNQCSLNMTDCTFHHNYAAEQGGAIHWNSATIGPMEVHGCTFHHNWSGTTGGAIRASTGIIIERCIFRDNTAETNGGAISFGSYTGGGKGHVASAGGVWYPTDGVLDLDSETVFIGNRAKGTSYPYYFPDNEVGHGGAIHVLADFVTMNGYWAAYLNNNYEPYKLQVNLKGATFENNWAQKDGGAVYMVRNTDFYGQISDLNFGTIKGNTAGRNGGAFYLTESLVSEMVSLNYHAVNSSWSDRVEPTTTLANGLGYYDYVRPDAPGITYHLVAQPIIANIGTDIASQNPDNLAMVMKENEAANGGGICVEGGSVVVYDNAVVGGDNSDKANICTGGNGGAVYVTGGNLTMKGGTFAYNQAKTGSGVGGNGGAFYVSGGLVDVRGGTINNNSAEENGGGFYVNTSSTTDTTLIRGGAQVTYNKAQNGGGAYISQGVLVVDDAATNISADTATIAGGGIYMANGMVYDTLATISGNVAKTSNGGAIYIGDGNITIANANISNNNAPSGNGGGVYVGAGGSAGNVTIKWGSTIAGNHADNGNGGAIYAGGGDIHFQQGTITGNSANNGGAIYANGGTMTFKDGIISNNQAHARGGGLYITESGNLALQGTATLTRNHVPSSGEGGGVYLAGVVYVGTPGGTSGSPKSDAITAEDNFADDDPSAVVDWTNRNNIYLPKPRVNSAHKDVVSIHAYGMTLYNSSTNTGTHVGFSVPRNFVPVIYCADDNYLATNKAALVATVFDDSQQYYTVWSSDLPYNKYYIYLSGLLWTEVVYEWPMTAYPASGFEVDGDGNVTVRSKEGLAWLISYVNGRTDDHPFASHNMKGKKVTIALDEGEDLDMHRYGWVPIGYGEKKKEFKGEFEGNGNSISGIVVTFGNEQGVFGDVTGHAKISNLFISNTALSSMKYNDSTFYMGGLACRVGDTAEIVGCGANGPMSCLEMATGVVMGGLVGKLYGNAKIHSCYATPEMEGFTMGGLVGEMAGGTVENCFSYPKFVAYDASTAYIGGLAAVMTDGRFENCFTHELAGSSHGTGGKFGWFAGNYTAGEFNYCYAPENANYVHTGTLGTTSGEGYGYYEPTTLVNGKYGFKHRDQDVTKAVDTHTNSYIENDIVDVNGNLKGLLATLNNWVDAQGSDAQYTRWMRTMGSYVNLDLPVLAYTNEVCLGSENGAIIYSKDVNDLLGDFLDGDIYLYATNTDTIKKSTKTNVRLYIAPKVGIKQSASATLNARVGVLLDNSDGSDLGGKPYDWHMFSTSLSDAPLGLTYNPNGESYTPAYGVDPPQLAIESGCYFPTDTPYGSPYTTNGSFDFYCFSEPASHWINFKRDSDDHWHEVEHFNLGYTNESALIPGKGYLLAVSYPTMVMADGTLNNGDFTSNVVRTEHNEVERGLDGVNLIGNPYQSYLNFAEFASDNGLTTYYLLDADKHEYLPYTVGGTESAETAPAALHPHQGFFVKVASTGSVQFKNSQRLSTGSAYSNFRGDRPKYPLVNLVCTDDEGRNDCAIVELNRPDTGGGEKVIGLRAGNASLWVHYDDADWHIAFTPAGIESVPVRFKAHEDGMYTLRWSTENADFSYLHLIDNLTGIDIDCLAADKYVFEGKREDYISRFRLVFNYTGLEEPESPEPAEGSTFAFQMGDQLIVNGEGTLQLFDVNGRMLVSTETYGTQTSLNLPKMSAGVYVLRLTGTQGVKVQKMVIK